MLTRRKFAVTVATMAALPSLARAAALVGDDGLHKQPWFTDSFLELGDDLATAKGNGKHLMVLWEQNACPYCRELHEVNFERREITDYIKQNFDVIQLNMFGARKVLDFDGEALEERDLASKWGVNFTPTTVLFHNENNGAKSIAKAETFRLPGYLKPFHYLSSLEFVAAEKFREQSFQRYLQDKFAKFKENGIDPDVW